MPLLAPVSPIPFDHPSGIPFDHPSGIPFSPRGVSLLGPHPLSETLADSIRNRRRIPLPAFAPENEGTACLVAIGAHRGSLRKPRASGDVTTHGVRKVTTLWIRSPAGISLRCAKTTTTDVPWDLGVSAHLRKMVHHQKIDKHSYPSLVSGIGVCAVDVHLIRRISPKVCLNVRPYI